MLGVEQVLQAVACVAELGPDVRAGGNGTPMSVLLAGIRGNSIDVDQLQIQALQLRATAGRERHQSVVTSRRLVTCLEYQGL